MVVAFSFSSPFNFLSSECTIAYLSWYWKELYNFGLLYIVLPCTSHDFLISSHAFSCMWLLVDICMSLPRNEILGLQKTHIWTNYSQANLYRLFLVCLFRTIYEFTCWIIFSALTYFLKNFNLSIVTQLLNCLSLKGQPTKACVGRQIGRCLWEVSLHTFLQFFSLFSSLFLIDL